MNAVVEATSTSLAAGTARRRMAATRLGLGKLDPVVQTAAAQRVVQFPAAVRGEYDGRLLHGLVSPKLRDSHRRLSEELEQKGLELVVGPVDLVDEQDRGLGAVEAHRTQYRTLLEELVGEQVRVL